MPSERTAFREAALAALAVFLVYLPTLSHGFVPWDDDLYLLSQEGWRGFGPAQWAWAFRATVGGVWQPLAWLSYGLDHVLWGMNPVGYHLTAVLIHAGAAALVVLIAVELFGKERRFAALMAGLFFAVHPLRVESVSWAAERRDVLSAFFVLAAVFAYLRGRMRLVLVFHALALLSKAQAAVLPALLLVLDYAQGRLSVERLRQKIPLFVLSGFAMAWAGSIQIRMRWSLYDHDLSGRVEQSLHGLVFYAAKSFWPVDLAPLYELRPPFVFTFYSIFGRILLVVIPILAYRRRWLAASALWYLLCLLPVLGLTQFGPQVVADRYSYIACLPLAFLAAIFLEAPKRRLAAGLFATALAFQCLSQQRVWADGQALWKRVLSVDPDSITGRVGLGTDLGPRSALGRLQAAALFYEALAQPACARAWGETDAESRRRALEPLPQCRKARFNQGVLRAMDEEWEEARKDFEALREFDPSDPVVLAALERLREQSKRPRRPRSRSV